MFKKHEDGTYSLSARFWTYAVIAAVIIGWIGWRTQSTANRQEEQARITTQFSNDTNECLADVVKVLTTRVGYNDALDGLDKRRQAIWQQLVEDLANADNSAGLSMIALNKWRAANDALIADQAKLTKERAENQYPDCPQVLKQQAPQPPK